MLDNRRAIGARIQRLRLHANLTQEAVVDATGLHRSTIQRIEAGTVDPQLSTLLLIADACGTTISELLRTQPPPARGTGEPAGGKGAGGPPG